MAQSTTDYKQFKILKGNRDIDKGHVAKLSKSINLNPDLLKARPVLVNENMEIIDGQHRFTACRAMGIPVWYDVVKDLTAEDAIALNRNQRNWTLLDFAKSHALAGKEDYRKFLDLVEEYPNIRSTTLITFLQGGSLKLQTANFREGKFVIVDEEQGRKYLDQLEDLLEIDARMSRTHVTDAILRLFKSENYDHSRMLKKMQQWGDVQFNAYGTVMDILRSFENVYNFHQTERGVVRLFS